MSALLDAPWKTRAHVGSRQHRGRQFAQVPSVWVAGVLGIVKSLTGAGRQQSVPRRTAMVCEKRLVESNLFTAHCEFDQRRDRHSFGRCVGTLEDGS